MLETVLGKMIHWKVLRLKFRNEKVRNEVGKFSNKLKNHLNRNGQEKLESFIKIGKKMQQIHWVT